LNGKVDQAIGRRSDHSPCRDPGHPAGKDESVDRSGPRDHRATIRGILRCQYLRPIVQRLPFQPHYLAMVQQCGSCLLARYLRCQPRATTHESLGLGRNPSAANRSDFGPDVQRSQVWRHANDGLRPDAPARQIDSVGCRYDLPLDRYHPPKPAAQRKNSMRSQIAG
jgi:hypothetical protein